MQPQAGGGHDGQLYREPPTTSAGRDRGPSPRRGPVSPRPSVVVADTDTGAPSRPRARAGLPYAGVRPGAVADHLDRRIADRESVLGEQIPDVGEHLRARHPATAAGRRRTPCRGHRLAEASSASHRDRDIAVGMTRAAIGAVEQQTEQPARPTGFDGCTSVPTPTRGRLIPAPRAPAGDRGGGHLEGQRITGDGVHLGCRGVPPVRRRR